MGDAELFDTAYLRLEHPLFDELRHEGHGRIWRDRVLHDILKLDQILRQH